MSKFSRIWLSLLLVATVANAQWPDHQLPGYAFGAFSVEDVDDDGDLDILGAQWNVHVQENRLPEDWTLEEHALGLTSGQIEDGEFVDFDGDGDLDLVYSGYTFTGQVVYSLGWIENLGDWEFEAHVIQEFDEGSQWNTLSAGDIEGDGDIDIVATIEPNGDYGLSVWNKQPDQSWQSLQIADVAHWGLSRLADLDADGYLDFVVMRSQDIADSTGGFYLHWGAPDGGFTSDHLKFVQAVGTAEPVIGDFDFDGDLDFATWHNRDDTYGQHPAMVSWWENLGDREFAEHVIFSSWTEAGIRPLAMLDSDNDGDTDIAFRDQIFANSGDNATFDLAPYTDVEDIEQLIAADIDNDGDTDLLNQEVTWFENPLIQVSVPENPSAVPTKTELFAMGHD